VKMVVLNLERATQDFALIAGQKRGIAGVSRLLADYSIPKVSDQVVGVIPIYSDVRARSGLYD